MPKKMEFPPLNKFIGGFLILMILFISSALLTLIFNDHDRLGLHHASLKTVIDFIIIFLILTATTFLSIWIAIKTKENRKVFLFFSTMIAVLHILGIAIAIYLSTKYTEIAFIVVIALTATAIILLLGNVSENKEH